MDKVTEAYRTEEPNDDVRLYDGPITIIHEENEVEWKGSIRLRWLPSPRIEFEVHPDSDSMPSGEAYTLFQLPEKVFVRVKGATSQAKALLLSSHSSSKGPGSLTGILNTPLEIGSAHEFSHVLFRLLNFRNFLTARGGVDPKALTDDWNPGRIVLQADNARVTIEPVENSEELLKKLKAVGGYAITHVGKLEGVSGNSISLDEVKVILSALRDFLSFVSGSVVCPILPVGSDAEGDIVWQEWAPWHTNSWKSVLCWSDDRHGESLPAVFPGFMARYRTFGWDKPVRDAVRWYAVSNRRQELCVEDALVLTQAALEMLAWVVCVEDPQAAHFTHKEFEKLQAAQKLRCLLHWAGIPLGIPEEAQQLRNVTCLPWKDGAEVCTGIRNSVVHTTSPKRRTIRVIPPGGLFQACNLALWYLELVLLRLFDYAGSYGNRLKRGRYAGDVEPVPWATKKGAPTE